MMRSATRGVATVVRPLARAGASVRRPFPLTVLGWHRVDALGGGVSTKLDVFRRQLDVLAAWGANVLPLDHACHALAQGRLPRRAVVLTFDDGYASVAETAWPLLRERDWPATLFVVSGYLDGTRRFGWDNGFADPRATLLDRRGVLDLAGDGMGIGSHTAEHHWLPHLADADLDRELGSSRAALAELLGRSVEAFAYPMGGWDRRVRAAAARAGYAVGVTTDRGANGARRDPLALRRTIAPDSSRDLGLVLDGAYDWLRPIDRWRSRSGPFVRPAAQPA